MIEGFVKELKCTVRACIDCGVLVAGGPTRCPRCAEASVNGRPIGVDYKDEWMLAVEREKSLEKKLSSMREFMQEYVDCWEHCRKNGNFMNEGAFARVFRAYLANN